VLDHVALESFRRAGGFLNGGEQLSLHVFVGRFGGGESRLLSGSKTHTRIGGDSNLDIKEFLGGRYQFVLDETNELVE
jgi:hypothetical protein